MSLVRTQRIRHVAAPAILLICAAYLMVAIPIDRHTQNNAPTLPDTIHTHPIADKNRGTVYLTDSERRFSTTISVALGLFAVAGALTVWDVREKRRKARADEKEALERFDGWQDDR